MSETQKTIIASIVVIACVIAGVFLIRLATRHQQSIVSPNTETTTFGVDMVSVGAMIPCRDAVGITVDPQSGVLVSDYKSKFAEYTVRIENGAQIPSVVAPILAEKISASLCDFEQSYNDTAISAQDQEMLGFLNPEGASHVRYNYTVFGKQMSTDRWGITYFVIDQYQYTGGAHGIGMLDGVIYDRINNQIITGKEFFLPSTLSELQKIVTKKLIAILGDMVNNDMIASGVTDSESLLGIIIPTETGITLKFQSYAVAPYAAGQPQVDLSFDEIRSLITPEWKERLGL